MRKASMPMLMFLFCLNSLCLADDKAPVPIAPISYFFLKNFQDNDVQFAGMFLEEDRDVYDFSNPASQRIYCYREKSMCIAITGKITGSGDSKLLDADIEEFVIESWTRMEIVAQSLALCYKNILTMRMSDKRVSLTQIPIYIADPLCKQISSQKTRGLLLKDGRRIWEREITKNCKKYYEKCN